MFSEFRNKYTGIALEVNEIKEKENEKSFY
jgi:hypothetical protein